MSERWYDDRPEPEQPVAGVLRAVAAHSTPGGRDRLPFLLEPDGGDPVPVYAPALEERLRGLVDQQVVLVGKRVDLSGEGFGTELWVGGVG